MIDPNLADSLGDLQIERGIEEPLYHYTSISNLKSILEDKEFWVTRSDFLNDPGEVIYFADLVTKIIDQLNLPKEWSHHLYENFRTYFPVAFQPRFYILSLSRNKDSLAMWNYYGKNDGYCMGINFNTLLENLNFKGYHYHHGSVLYDEESQVKILKDELQLTYNYWLTNHEAAENMLLAMIDTLIGRWVFYALFFKHKGFQQEEEYRIVFGDQNNLTVNYRPGHGVFTPYIKVPAVKNNEKFPLESITIGPLIKHDNAERGLAEWSRHKELFDGPPCIHRSTIPLRF